ncbi:DNA excision repair protein ERCC-1 [Caerostris extrusa]|uniref:DNA excision repair protein ERCC-1 n=1 Tax=Caerostris extrusa TaxID=172846 RepID=A0AAV4M4N1_CAEEX|nr:DNA excision repair protein ERCC-1 [Caerostris extrusa]
MEKSTKKFCIPQDMDNFSEESISTAPRYFKPGNILGDATSKDSASSESNQSSNIPDFPVARNPQAPSAERAAEFQNKVRKYGKIKKCFGSYCKPKAERKPLLKHIRNVPWEFSEIEPDYLMSKSTCALFLSLRYHNLFPNYIHDRLKALGKSYNLRVLLVQVDVAEPNPPLKDLFCDIHFG